jgi:hypothetical protein
LTVVALQPIQFERKSGKDGQGIVAAIDTGHGREKSGKSGQPIVLTTKNSKGRRKFRQGCQLVVSAVESV